jgi:hypothetical protein
LFYTFSGEVTNLAIAILAIAAGTRAVGAAKDVTRPSTIEMLRSIMLIVPVSRMIAT